VKIQSAIFWIMASCTLAWCNKRVSGICCLHLQYSIADFGDEIWNLDLPITKGKCCLLNSGINNVRDNWEHIGHNFMNYSVNLVLITRFIWNGPFLKRWTHLHEKYALIFFIVILTPGEFSLFHTQKLQDNPRTYWLSKGHAHGTQ
jgi:hypothetical protein